MTKTLLENNESGFSIQGRVDFGNVLTLRRDGEQRIHASKNTPVVIDLSKVNDHDAAIFTLLLCWLRFAKLHAKQLHLQHVPVSLQRMQALFELSILN